MNTVSHENMGHSIVHGIFHDYPTSGFTESLIPAENGQKKLEATSRSLHLLPTLPCSLCASRLEKVAWNVGVSAPKRRGFMGNHGKMWCSTPLGFVNLADLIGESQLWSKHRYLLGKTTGPVSFPLHEYFSHSGPQNVKSNFDLLSEKGRGSGIGSSSDIDLGVC